MPRLENVPVATASLWRCRGWMKAGIWENWKCFFAIAAVSFGHRDNQSLYEMMISQKISEEHSGEHKLLGIRKGFSSVFLQWVVIGKVKTKHRVDLQFCPPHSSLG